LTQATASEPALDATEQTPNDARSSVLRASSWTVLGYGGASALRLVSNVILWRLLFEEAFGIMALVGSLLIALTMFSDIGIGPAIIQHPRGDDPSYLNTAWTVQVARGAMIWLLCAALAVPMARFYDQPVLADVVPVVGCMAFVQGFGSTRLYTEQRMLRMGRFTLLELFGQLVTTVTMIVWAWFSPTVWALAAGGIAGPLVKAVLSHFVLPGVPNRFHWDRSAARELTTLGRWIFLSTMLTFLASQSDRLIFGKLVDLALLGVYSIAQTLATAPSSLLAHMIQSVLFPHLSRELQRGAPLGPSYRKVRVPTAIFGGFLCGALIVAGPTFIDLVYGDRAEDAGLMVQILMLGNWFTTLRLLAGSAMLALGRPKWLALANAAQVLGMLALIPAGDALFGFFGAILGLAAAQIGSYAALLVVTHRLGLRAWPQDLALTLVFALACGAGWLVRLASRAMGLPLALELALLVLSAAALWGLIYLRRGALEAATERAVRGA
jgi:O-antigen/teichoic acid export membrane protein